MFVNTETTYLLTYLLQDHYDDERYKIVFHKTTPQLQDQDQDHRPVTTACKTKKSVLVLTKTDFFWTQNGLVLRPTVSDNITGAFF